MVWLEEVRGFDQLSVAGLFRCLGIGLLTTNYEPTNIHTQLTHVQLGRLFIFIFYIEFFTGIFHTQSISYNTCRVRIQVQRL